MSYLVLARKYRPRSFEEMVGQEHVVQALGNALRTQRLHHAYLFTGTRGVGKTTVSRILAKSLNCQGADGQGGITDKPCGVCQACRDIDAGRFVDYTELDAASNRGVDEVQTLLEQAVYKPVQGRFKVFMIDEVHMLTNTAFNAMLKTLEEPPEYLKFVLATTDPQKVPVTVLSRCLQFNLRPMAPQTVLEHLEKVLQTEQVSADVQSLRLLARAARGSMRDALSLTDQAIAFGSGSLQEDQVRQMLGSVDRSYVLRLLQALAEGQAKAVVDTVEELRLHGLSAAATLEDMAALLQRMAVLQMVGSDEARDADADPDHQALLALAEQMPADETQLLYSLCLHGRTELGLAPDEYAALTMVLLRLMAFKPEAFGQAEKKTLKSAQPEGPARTEPARAAPSSERSTAPTASMATPRPGSVSAQQTAPAARNVVTPASAAPAVQAVEATPVHAPSAVPSPAVEARPALEVRSLPVLDMAERRPGAASAPIASAGSAAPLAALQAVPVVDAGPAQRDVALASTPTAPVTSAEGDFWFELVQSMVAEESITAFVRELALNAQLVARDETQWLLRVERESLNQAGSRDRLVAALAKAGYPVGLAVEVGRVQDSPAKRNAAAAAARQLQAEKIVFEDPLVQALMREFEAKIVPGSIKPL
jgi:DNA polymerase-3 subunit gamma/tau